MTKADAFASNNYLLYDFKLLFYLHYLYLGFLG